MNEKVLVRLENVSKTFGKQTVIKNLSLDIYEGEFITLLGPSGCGKTTVLRMISGLETATSGKVFIDSEDVTFVDPTKREVNTIFQNFALFPKMTVTDNIAFGLKMKKVPKEEIAKRVAKVIKLVKLDGLEDRYPKELSGGQQQRVAIARGIIMNPKVLLLDESLCSLDLKLKKSMQVELKKLQKKLGLTFVYVTHNQEEALSMSDRIAIINKGVIEQLDTPIDIYMRPKTIFVADFIGEANILEAIVKEVKEGSIVVKIFNDELLEIKTEEEFSKNDKIKLIIRPEHISVSKNSNSNMKGIITDITYIGDTTKLTIDVSGIDIKISITEESKFKENEEVYIKFNRNYIVPLRR